eukprot:CAMPEP_0198117778 /NCGR_PEP_ID=MMETSP1442-20131203/19254_1 /TAXON_ID= /ORGANISM="Craspedostauros australis, Strain CCMP3328" /LENGTH=50 /DNA_ID=CAMNT_0043775897 /DNA_START=1 /DNA_END=150 /DNA_ORIENTATION=+
MPGFVSSSHSTAPNKNRIATGAVLCGLTNNINNGNANNRIPEIDNQGGYH